MSKHTQGGWRLQKDFVVFDEDGQCAQVCGHNKEANARLIATDWQRNKQYHGLGVMSLVQRLSL